MDILESILPTKMLEILDRNGISSLKQLILLSSCDIKKMTSLTNEDIGLIKTMVSRYVLPQCVTCDKQLDQVDHSKDRVTTGCDGINYILKGGFRKGTITEIFGESGCGKTQIAIQATICNWDKGCVYICTEDVFPVKRYEQMKRTIPNFNSNIDYGINTFIEHVTESEELLSCIRVRLPKLLLQKNIALVVIDSIAAPFRVEHTNYIQRAQELRELAISVINIAQTHNLAILCINQVTAAFNESVENTIPSLGLAWSNMICTRLRLKKINSQISINNQGNSEEYSVNIRELHIESSPELPYAIASFIITPNGVGDV